MVNESICVIGISGFVGSHVAAELLSRGYSVHGTMRDSRSENSTWLHDRLVPMASTAAQLRIVSAELADKPSLFAAMQGCSGVIMCAGVEQQKPETVDLMVGAANNVLDNALELGITRAVFTSSTGSTNPPSGEPERKNEIDHWSDPQVQIEAGKYSPAAKTLMDQTALARMQDAGGQLRVCILNPSMIVGPAFQPEPVASLKAFQAIIDGRRYADNIPNGSMSMIDVRDLAKLHVNALENDAASGRYFGVKKSWHWQDILAALEQAYPNYQMPSVSADQQTARPTQFDLSRQSSLGVQVRDLPAMLEDVVGELKSREMI